jgi:CRP-like cAMP-binding protein
MSATVQDVVTVVRELEASQRTPPVVIDIEEKLTEITTADHEAAYEAVANALELGVIEEDTSRSGFGGIQLADDTDPPGSGDTTGEYARSPGANPGGNTDDSPTYRDLYLQAWANSSADRAFVPHEDMHPVFAAAGLGDLLERGALPYNEWITWTPDGRDTPLYAYTPDLAGDTSTQRETLAGLFREAGVSTTRFINVHDGQKGSFDTGNFRDPDDPELSGNYGVKGGRIGDDDKWLVDFDIDDYDDAKETNTRVQALRNETLSVASAHTTQHDPGHLYVAVEGNVAAIVQDLLGRDDVVNLNASFGEVRIENQYVVGPGSEIVCGCDLCSNSDADADDHDDAANYGRYEIATEQPPVTWSADEFREFLEADPAINTAPDPVDGDGTGPGNSRTTSEGTGSHRQSPPSVSFDDDDGRLTLAETVDEYVQEALEGTTNPDDRSQADSRLAAAVAPWVGNDTDTIANVLDEHGTSKWDNRTDDSYRSSILGYAENKTHTVYDPLPYWVLREVAVEDELLTREELVQRDVDTGEVVTEEATTDGENGTYTALPPRTYNGVLSHIEEEYGVAPGRDPVQPTAALPFEVLDTLDVQEAQRYARKRGIEWASTREARERLRNDIFEVMNHTDKKVIDAPTALGKSHTIATEPWQRRASTTGEQPVIHTHETTEARDQAADASAKADVKHAVLKGRTEACPVAAGEYDSLGRASEDVVITLNGTPASEWFENVCDNRGLPFSVAHKYLDTHNDQHADLPCCAGDGEECSAITQWNGLPRNDDGAPAVDVIHCTHQFAHVPSLRSHTNLIFDERPNFAEDLTHEQVRLAITAYLSAAADAADDDMTVPVTTHEELVTGAQNGDTNRHIKQLLEYEPEREWYLETPHAHTLAPALAKAVYYALRPPKENEVDAQDANGRYATTIPHNPPRLDANASDEDRWNRTWVSIVLDAENTVQTVRNTPDLGAARSIIGLDAHPAETQWQQNVDPVIETTAVLDTQERALWRRFERGLLTVGVGEATRPFASSEYFDADGSKAFFEALRERYGEAFNTAITAKSVQDRTRAMLEEVGCDDPELMTYGEEKSRNDFADEDVGALNGSIDPGDDFVLNLLAEAGLNATPEMTENADGEPERAHGRGFVGPDADAAAELLGSVREQHVAQSAGRYARNADDPEDRAIVFVRTDAAPPGFLDMQVPGVEWVSTETQREIIEALRDRTSATTRELAEAVDCSKEHVRDTLQRLRDNEVVSVRENAGDHGAHLYRVLAGRDSSPSHEVDLSPQSAGKTTNEPVQCYYTWSLAVCSELPSGSVTVQGESTETTAGSETPPESEGVDGTGPPG